MDTCVISTLLYACETWTMKKQDRLKLNAFEMKCYRKMLKISYKDMIKNDTIRKDLGRTKTVVEKIKDRKLSIFGHICRMRDERIIKTVMMGRSDGMRKRGRPKRRWIDDILEWTGLDTTQNAIRMAKERKGPWASTSTPLAPTVLMDYGV